MIKSKVYFITRKPNTHNYSIEKLFSILSDYINNQSKSFTVKIITLPFESKGVLRRALNCMYVLFLSADVYHVTGDVHYVTLFLKKSKTILTIHDNRTYYRLNGWRRRLYYYIWLYIPSISVKYITTISTKTHDELSAIIPRALQKIKIIPNFTTISYIQNHKIRRDDKRILFVGTATNKNLESVVKAIDKTKFTLRIIGKLSRDQLHHIDNFKINYTNAYDISEKSLIHEYLSAKFLVFPSFYEGFGLPIIEANFLGCAVITSNIEPMRSVACDSAILVDPNSAKSIKVALERISSDDVLYNYLIAEGYKNSERYTIKKVSTLYCDLYKKILLK